MIEALLTFALSATQGYYRQPALHGDTLLFVAEGDIWSVPRTGGAAVRLTSHEGNEVHPAISPDGARVAFVASYEGPSDVYVMPIGGGLPQRLTFEGDGMETYAWTPDGRVILSTRSQSTLPNMQILLLDPKDPAKPGAELVPLAQAAEAAYDPSGATLIFTRLNFQGSHAKRYKGGTAQNLWRFDPGAPEARPLTADYTGTSRQPMWHAGRVYFASDRDGTMNLWSMAPEGGDVRQHTKHAGLDVLGPSIDAGGSGRIVYQLGADLRAFDPRDSSDRAIEITLASDFDQTRETWIARPLDFVTAAHPSPDGKQVVLTARGRVFVAPAKQGRLVEVEGDSGVRWRDARFIPSGIAADKKSRPSSRLLAISDKSGEVELWTLPANGVAGGDSDPAQVTRGGTVLRWNGVPSPDGRWAAHTDKDHRLWLVDLASREAGADRLVVQSKLEDFEQIAWAPDSRWFAVVERAPNFMQRVLLVRVEDAVATPVTTDRFNSFSPAFSADGDWLYLLSDRNLSTVVRSPWGAYQPEPFMNRMTRIYALPMRAGLRSPFAPETELAPPDKDKDKEKDKDKPKEEKPKDEPPADAKPEDKKPDEPKPDDAKAEEKKPAAEAVPVPPIVVELEGIIERLEELPLSAGRMSSLTVNAKTLFWIQRDLDAPDDAPPPGVLQSVDIARDDLKVVTVVDKCASYEMSLDGQTLLVRREGAMNLVPAKAIAADLAKTAVDLSGWSLSIVPREQWKQMFVDAWRLHRDYFYDPNMHGVDWKAMRAKYEPLVERVASRAELSDLLAQMVGELSALHTFVRGGDQRQGTDQVTVGLLGAQLLRDDAAGGWRVAHLYRHDPDEPGSAGPLARPESRVKEGEIIERINGVSTLSVAHPALMLRNESGRQTLLHVRGEDGTVREVIVKPTTSMRATDLRYTDWELSRREKVEKEGEGRLGYVHLRAMGEDNWTEWAKGYFPIFAREGLIIDVRHNRGGNIDSWILNRLLRKAWFGWSDRVGNPPTWNMQYAFRGHIIVLCNEWTASDGEAFAEGIKRLKIGPVLGTRTWGGEIWLSSSNVLVDRGVATAAETGVFGPEGTWLIEGHGVEPDMVVDNLPHETFNGRDRQLEAAIAYLKKKIAEEPIPVLARPEFPRK